MASLLVIINSATFLIYGLLCLFTNHMYDEFKRYGLLKYRKLTGFLEICGAIGSFFGFLYNMPMLLFFSAGLAILMALGISTRLRVKDKFHQALPALVLFFLNCYIAFTAYSKIDIQ
jgi:hypothetical protein